MSYAQKLNTATVWENQKQKDSQPDFRGTINVEGKEFEIALWKKTSSGGKRFLGGTVQEPRQNQKQLDHPPQRAIEPNAYDDLNDDPPW